MIMGIDPGKSGAIAVLNFDGTVETVVSLKNMTERDLFDYIKTFGPGYINKSFPHYDRRVKIAYLEKVASMPQNGCKAIWTFSGSYHGIRMALIGNKIKFKEVRPLRWQSELKCRTGGDKNITKARAQELFPDIKITHAIADALLIAEFGRKQERIN